MSRLSQLILVSAEQNTTYRPMSVMCMGGMSVMLLAVPDAFHGFRFSLPDLCVMSATALSCGTIVAPDRSDS